VCSCATVSDVGAPVVAGVAQVTASPARAANATPPAANGASTL
jgi:hypothetical protein